MKFFRTYTGTIVFCLIGAFAFGLWQNSDYAGTFMFVFLWIMLIGAIKP